MMQALPDDRPPQRPTRIGVTLLAVSFLAASIALVVTYALGSDRRDDGPIEHEEKSEFSHIRIRRQENVRTLLFVGEGGREAVESRIDLDRPDRLILPYTRFMFTNYLIAPEPRRALIVGLGGGGMVHFLKRRDHDLALFVVEIDPVVVRLADEYFGVRSEGNLRVVKSDALIFLEENADPYDVIYMDAFLGATDATDSSGVPLHLKTAPFFDLVKSRLERDGVVVFNLHRHRHHSEDLHAIRAAFPQVYVFSVPGSGNVIVAACMHDARLSSTTLQKRAAALDKAFGGSISFVELLESLAQ